MIVLGFGMAISVAPLHHSTDNRHAAGLVCLRFLQVEVAFEIPKHLIVDPSVVAKSQQGAPLHAKQLVRQRSGLAVLPWRLCCVIRRSGQGLESFAIMLGEIVVHSLHPRACRGYAILPDDARAACKAMRWASSISQFRPDPPG